MDLVQAPSLTEDRVERILVLQIGEATASSECRKRLKIAFPSSEILSTLDPVEANRALATQAFSLILIEGEAKDVTPFVSTIKLHDLDPAVLLITSSSEPEEIAEAYRAGAHRVIIRSGSWGEDLGPAARHLLRLRRLESENRKLLSKLTEANRLLEEKNRRLDEFSATLAHDIRGPLGGISMKLDYIIETEGEKLNEKFKMLLVRALASTDRLTKVVQAMYDFAKLGAQATKMEDVPLIPLVEEVISELVVEESLDVRIALGDLPVVWGNRALLQRVFQNLIANAIKYNNKRSIVIEVGSRGIEERSLARFGKIFVADNGPGIPRDEREEIFSMFSRGNSTPGNHDGVGIGLAVVQRIIELHFGSVVIEDTPGGGTTFVITLPIERTDFAGS